MTGFSDKGNLFAEQLVKDMPADEVDWWEEAARRAVKFFPDKQAYLGWVHGTYGGEENRFPASVWWDIIKLAQSQVGKT